MTPPPASSAPAAASVPATGETESLVETHQSVFFPWVKPYYAQPVVMTEAEGVWVKDDSGNTYLDLFAGILTTSIGHCHPEVVSRVQAQVARLGHTSALYVTEGQVEVAKTLIGMAPGRLTKAAFTNSGTEANETAVTAAFRYTGRSEIIALRHSYSGRSILAANLTAHAPWRPLPSSVAGIKHARAPYVYRSPLGSDVSEEEQTKFFLDDLVEVIETTTSGRPAALLVESIMGVGGFIVPPRGYLEGAAEIIRTLGGVFISDEVQSGFGRTGTHWFGCQHAGVEPDIMVMAKGIASGFPVGATLATDEIAEVWPGPSVSTYGGNPISMAATQATLDVMHREDVRTRSDVRGAQLRAGLVALQAEHPWIGDVRGMGLMQAMEIVTDPVSKTPDAARTRALMEAAREERLLIGAGGLKGNVIRIGPSMLITEAEMEEALVRLNRAAQKAARAS
jgi:alanine-glyoxylate transaminase/(R)-3-amino-2-methylpropionate-pyruvate transaminase